MKFKSVTVLLITLFLLTACSRPLAYDKLDYSGEWRSKEMYLLILPDGTVAYQRVENGVTRSVNGPLKEFVGNDFVVGIGFLTTRFIVSEAPTKSGGIWTMTVDGIRLIKTVKN